jgi:hypothetical protein
VQETATRYGGEEGELLLNVENNRRGAVFQLGSRKQLITSGLKKNSMLRNIIEDLEFGLM